MSDKTDSPKFPGAIDTLIGAGMCVHGDIACSGTLRVQGTLEGNVNCDSEPGAALVVDGAGNVTGTVHAAHLIVRGRIVGPVHSTGSIEVHSGASVTGAVAFKQLAIHTGGVVDGLMVPVAAMERTPAVEAAESAAKAPARETAAGRVPRPAATGAAADLLQRLGGAPRAAVFGTAAAALVVGAIVLTSGGRDAAQPPQPSPPAAAATTGEQPAAAAAAAQPPAAREEPRGEPAAEPRESAAVPLAPSLSVATTPPASAAGAAPPASGGELPAKGDQKIVTVRGANPVRPPGVFLLISSDASVLYKKKRDDPGEGTRIATEPGEKASVSIGPDELIRVAKGRDITIYYQGQKVSRRDIDSGAWISFVPK